MQTLPQHARRRPKPENETEVARQVRTKPGEALVPFLPAYLYELPDNTLLMPREVASLFRVDTKTVSRWANNPKNPLIRFRTPGGHLRLNTKNVRELYEGANEKVVIEG